MSLKTKKTVGVKCFLKAEIQRSKDKGAAPELIKEYKDGIIQWQTDYNRIMKYNSKDAQWAKDTSLILVKKKE